jgi:hypothetical protein
VNGRNAENMEMALLAEWACMDWLGLPHHDLLPPSCAAAAGNDHHDGGVDIDCGPGYRIDVKAARPRYPELMLPVKHEAKYRKTTCPVDIFVKATVERQHVTMTCWQWRAEFLRSCHRDDGERYPYPTLWQAPDEAHPIGASFDVDPFTAARIQHYVRYEMPDTPWEAWLTL